MNNNLRNQKISYALWEAINKDMESYYWGESAKKLYLYGFLTLLALIVGAVFVP